MSRFTNFLSTLVAVMLITVLAIGQSMPENLGQAVEPGLEPAEQSLFKGCEDFDDLTVGGYVAEQLGGYWTTWSGAPGGSEDAFVTDAQSNSPNNSFVVDDGGIDLILELGDAAISAGQWLYSHYMYVPSGFSGYFNVQEDPTPAVGWNIELFFDDGGAGHFAGQSTETFSYDQDTWFQVEIIYDFDAGIAQVFFDGEIVVEFANTMTIGGIDYFGADTGGDPGAYYDDVCFGEYTPGGPCENFDALTVGDYVASQLGGYWTTWSGAPGGSEDAFVTDAQSNSPNNSFVVDDGGIDLILELGDAVISTGQWLYSHYMYVPSGYSGYFNVQEDLTPGVGWNIELFFDDGGEGHFAGQSTETFTYDQDTWFLVEINYDFESGFGEVLLDGALITQFANTMTIGGIDYFGADTGGDPGAYYDDVCFGEGWVITGVVEETFVHNTHVYPNPATDVINIKSDLLMESITIFNQTGQVVATEKVNDKQIQIKISQYNPGIYFLRIETEEGVESKRIIIQ